ncbi:hypothetical protein L210DRAFT_3537498 [Boletus edulis BED1]|uniref:Uncharacterized protein n=1 Tax=Boletus edulis BED1 TaxID=1328754 RepID=A0AAD4GGN8_BOLED|nr:hypothetical protein L210DRAFT_3537498 [Boletus edulis BED1]
MRHLARPVCIPELPGLSSLSNYTSGTKAQSAIQYDTVSVAPDKPAERGALVEPKATVSPVAPVGTEEPLKKKQKKMFKLPRPLRVPR